MENTYNQIEINKQLKRTARDSLIYLPAKVVPAIIGILLIRILTTIFSAEEYGHYQIALSTFGFIKIFSMIWLTTSVTRFYLNYKYKDQESIFFSTLFISCLSGATIIALISFIINFLLFRGKIDPFLFYLINIAIAASLFNTFFEVFVMVFRAGLESKKYSLFWILFSVGKLFLSVGLILVFDFRMDAMFWAFLFVPLILDIIIFSKLRLYEYLKISSISIDLFKQFTKYGIPISFAFFSFWILSLSDRYLIEFFRGSSEVGLYSVGYTISEKTLNFIYMILMLAAYPIIVDNWEKYGDERTQKLITELTRYFLLICTPILIVLVIIPEHVMILFSSSKFIDGAKVLPLIAIGVFLYGLTQYVLKGFELHKKSIKITFLALVGGITNICLNIVVIPKFGFLGAGISACIAYIIYFFSATYLVRREMAWEPPYHSIINILIAAILNGFYLKYISYIVQNIFFIVFFVIPTGLALFVSTLILLKEIKISEMKKGWNFILGLFKA